ncbi:hypothetical protein FKP32DRAFT_1681319 [Trametes sanguinea]|nr:hypothetical protein FKP32DRAFT_1681319 [Trametes sanguinea]
MQHAQKRPEQRNSQVAVNEPPGGQPSDYTPGHVERRSATPSPAITTPPADQNSGISNSIILEVEIMATYAIEAWRIAHLEEPPLSRPPAQESDVQQEESEAPSAMQESAAPSCAEEGSAPSGAESPSATSNYLPTPRSDSGRLPRLSLVLSEPAARAERTSSPTPEAHSSPSGSSSLLRFPSDPSIASDIVISTGGSNSGSDGSPSVISSPSEILSPGSVFSDFTVVAEDDDESDIFFSPRSEMFSPVGSVMGRTF